MTFLYGHKQNVRAKPNDKSSKIRNSVTVRDFTEPCVVSVIINETVSSAYKSAHMKNSFPKLLTSTPTCYSFAAQITAKWPIFKTKFSANEQYRH